MKPRPIRITGVARDRVVTAPELEAMIGTEAGGSVPVAALLDLVTVDAAVRRVHVSSEDGTYSASIPIDEIRRGGVITVESEGNRLRVLDGSTLCWNVKQVGVLRVTVAREPDSVPRRPTH